MRAQLPIDARLGNYRLERLVSASDTGAIYHAVHTLLPRRAVIKVLDATQLLREAVILEALHHPGIVRVYESGIIPGELLQRRAWFARELADGPTVASALAPGVQDRGIDRLDAARLLRDLAEVLGHAHRRGIIHCGLRPARVVRCGTRPMAGQAHRGFPLCITDWSDARAHDAAAVPFVASPESWHYASPELAKGDPIDDRVDIYALGVIAYQLLTGTLPFAQRAIAATGETQHIPTEVHCPDVPRELTQLVDQMLAYDQWDRPSSVEVHAQLGELVEMLATPPARVLGSQRIRKPRWTPVDALSGWGGERTPTPPPDATGRDTDERSS